MLYEQRDSERVQAWLIEAMAHHAGSPDRKQWGPLKDKIAAACGCTRAAVDGWISTGRMRKGNLAILVDLFAIPGPFGEQPRASTPAGPQAQDLKGAYKLSAAAPWPLPTVSLAELQGLPAAELQMIDAYIRGMLDARKSRSA
jgi:hypothetical protein